MSKTFTQAVNGVCDIPISQLPQPIIKGNRLSINILEDEYQTTVEACKHNLHGRILWPKGEKLLPILMIRNKLMAIWKDLGKWGVISLRKGFFEFTVLSLEDVRRVCASGVWSLSPGLLKLFSWTNDFTPSIQPSNTAQV